MIILMARLFRKEGRYKAITPWLLTLVMVSFCGFVLIAFGQKRDLVTLGFLGEASILALFPGIALALISVALGTFSSYSFRWRTEFSRSIPEEFSGGTGLRSLELFGVLIASLIASIAATPLNLGTAIAMGEEFTDLGSGGWSIAVAGGVLTLAVGNIAWRWSNLVTKNLSINALSYTTPVISLGWLFLFSQVAYVRLDFILIGAAAIIVANLLICIAWAE